MALTDSLPTGDSGGLSLTDWRRIQAGMVARAADGSPRVGVLPAHFNALVTGRASMGFDVAPFVAVTSRESGRVEFLANDGTVTVPTTAAPGANSRIDVVWVRPQFTAASDAGDVPVFGVTQGTPAASPSKPAIPAGALELAAATITSTTTTTQTVVITQTHPYTAMAGGVVPVRNSTELAAWAPADGGLAVQLDSGAVVQRRAGAPGGWAPAGTATPFGHAGKAGATQNLPGGGLDIVTVTAQDLAGGVTMVSNSLIVPVAGRYDIRACARVSGLSTGMVRAVIQVDGANTVEDRFSKPLDSDAASTFGMKRSLTAGQGVRLVIDYPGGAVGTDGYNGCFIEVERISA